MRRVNVVFSVGLVLMLIGCSSIPKPITSNSTLLVVNSIRTGERAAKISIQDFFLVFENGTIKRINMAREDNITLISDFESGQVATKALRVRLSDSAMSASGENCLDYPLRIETTVAAGSYAIFPVIISYYGKTKSEDQNEIGMNFSMVDSTDIKKIQHALDRLGIPNQMLRTE
jgi:hypothetical protein